jgi:hypothetical protein
MNTKLISFWQPMWRMTLALLFVLGLCLAPASAVEAGVIPTFSILSVDKDVSVTIMTYNLPASQDFTVRMGAYGTLGIGGIVVKTTSSGVGGSQKLTYDIPVSLKGSKRIAIRMDSTKGYYAYNWFWNNTAPGGTSTGYSGIPTFSITAVEKDVKVTLKTKNLPPSQTFTVRMGAYGGVIVGTVDSAAGAVQTLSFNVPASLKGSTRIAIRMDSSLGYYAFNWFWNNSTSGGTVTPGYSGIPTFAIQAVVKDVSVTVKTKNLPPSQNFTVRMGAYGTLGLGGVVVAVLNSGVGGVQTLSFTIPASLKGSSRLAVRMDSDKGYYAYNWFWNTSTP